MRRKKMSEVIGELELLGDEEEPYCSIVVKTGDDGSICVRGNVDPCLMWDGPPKDTIAAFFRMVEKKVDSLCGGGKSVARLPAQVEEETDDYNPVLDTQIDHYRYVAQDGRASLGRAVSPLLDLGLIFVGDLVQFTRDEIQEGRKPYCSRLGKKSWELIDGFLKAHGISFGCAPLWTPPSMGKIRTRSDSRWLKPFRDIYLSKRPE